MIAPGTVIAGRYRLDERAAAGGAGVIYRATDLTCATLVAVKLLHGDSGFDTRRFQREVAILEQTSGAHVVRFVDSGVLPDLGPYLVMEWLEGETLTARLAREPLSPAQAIDLGVLLAETLARVHDAGIIHRDLKPSNIYLPGGELGQVKLLDFGIAKSRSHERLTVTGDAFGTIGYMSPEQVCGDRDVDARSDIFSLGCVLFECATGQLPFRVESANEWLMKLALEDAPPASRVRSDVSEELSLVLARMLQKIPTDRSSAMSEVAAALRAVRESPQAGPVSRSGPAIGTAERRFATLILFGAAPPSDVAAALARKAAELGGKVHEAPGRALIAFSASDAPAEIARAAARLSLETSAAWPTGKLVVISVRSTPDRNDLDATYARAVGLLEHARTGVTVDEATRGLVRDAFECTARGVDRGFELGAVGSSERASGRQRMTSSSPFVGRERELSIVLDGYQRAVADRAPGAVLLTGAAGVGKSRIANEARARIRSHGSAPTLLIGSADDGDRAAAFSLLSEMLARHFGLPPADRASARARRDELLRGVLRELPGSEAASVAELLGELLVGPTDAPSPALVAARSESRLMNDRLRFALSQLVRAIARRGPVLFVIEHVERADAASITFLSQFLASHADAPLFVLASARPEVHERFPKLFSDCALTTLTVPELPRAAATALARALLATRADRVDSTVELCGGNPLFIEELARSVREGHDDALPESILALSQSRLDRLTDRERRFLRAASVFGRRFPLHGASTLLKSQVESETAQALESRSVIRALGDAQLEFVSPTLREVAYASIPENELPRAHRAAAELLEQAGNARAIAIAQHWELAGEAASARPWFLRAGREALAANDLVGAARAADKAIAAASTPADLGAARVLRAEVEDHRWAWRDAEPYAVGALEVLEPGSILWFVAVDTLIRVYTRTARIPEFHALVARAREVPPGPGALNGAVLALACAATNIAVAGDDDLEPTMARLEALDSQLPDEASGKAGTILARGGCALRAGDLGAYHDRRREAAERFDRLCDWRKAIETWGTAGYANALLGRYEQAQAILERCIERALEYRMPTVNYLRHNLGYVLLELGRYEPARAMLELTLEPLAAHPYLLRGSQRYMARTLLQLGDVAGAERLARAALSTSELPSQIAAGRADLAHVVCEKGALAEARELIEQAAATLTEDAAFDEAEPFIRLTLAEVRARSGDRAGAYQAARAGVARLAALAAKIQDPAARASFLENVPAHRAIRQLQNELAPLG